MSNPNAKPHLEPPKRTYFFERKDGSWFACLGEEAWNNYRDKKFTYVGTSDGVKFFESVKAAQELDRQGKRDEAQDVLRKAVEDAYEESKSDPTPPKDIDYLDLGKR